MTEDYMVIEKLAIGDAIVLEEKGATYGDSWRKRGGIGAFMMLCRKWDRIENICREHGWDVFEAVARNEGDIIDDIRDLRRYLLLVDAYVISRQDSAEMKAYTNPDHDQMDV